MPGPVFDPAVALAHLTRGSRAGRLVHARTVPARAGNEAPWPDWVAPSVTAALHGEGISALWEHQARVAQMARDGQDVVVATGTASGKSLGYLLPVLTALSEGAEAASGRGATALYLAPTKALGADQAARLHTLAVPGVRTATLDGDTPTEERRWIRDHAHYVLTNPDLLHHTLLPGHERWRGFLRSLRYVVVDECHVYRGVFGAHVSAVLRRLLRVAARSGAHPTVIAASATVADPAGLVSSLVGRPVTAVTEDGSPRNETLVALWQPPELDDGSRLSTLVEAGAVLADVAAAPHLVTSQDGTPAVVALRRNWRSNTEINELSDAVLAGDVARALALLEEGRDCTLTPFTGTETLGSFRHLTDSLRDCAAAVVDAAARGDGVGANAALGRHRVLCAHREGPFGVGRWSDLVRSFLAGQLPGYGDGAAHWVGQPLLITRNNGTLSNGDTAVVVRDGSRLVAAVEQASGELRVDPTVLDGAADLHAMTIHKSQGSQFDAVSVVVPPVGSPLLTRELLYTAITRARSSVRLYGSPEALAEAIATPSHRSSGLRRPPEDQA